MTFCRRVRWGHIKSCWKTTVISGHGGGLLASSQKGKEKDRLSIERSPEVGGSIRETARIRTDLPAPFGPTIAIAFPGFTWRVIPLMISFPERILDIFLAASIEGISVSFPKGRVQSAAGARKQTHLGEDK